MRGEPSPKTVNEVLCQVTGDVLSPKEIAAALGCSLRTVQRCLTLLDLEGRVCQGFVATRSVQLLRQRAVPGQASPVHLN